MSATTVTPDLASTLTTEPLGAAAVDSAAVETAAVDTGDRLSFTVFLALALHALLLLGVSFSIEPRGTAAPTLQITLASHRADKAPETADFLAQHNQEASGTLDEARELTTEAPSPFADTQIRDINPSPQTRAQDPSERQVRQQVTTTGSSNRQVLLEVDPNPSEAREQRQGEREDQPLVSAEIASLQAKLDRQRQAYAKRPRVRRLTSVATRASFDAEYLQRWSTQVESVGNRNFPQQALRDKIFGALRLLVILNPDGTIEKVETLQSSGHRLLDESALQIVHLAAPFAPFPPEIRKHYDQLEIIRTWQFEISGFSTDR